VNKPYWSRASRILAEKAEKKAYVILNGTTTGIFTAYWTGSIFGKTELPRLGSLGKVKKLVILVAMDVDRPPKERCGEGTLVDLQKDAKKYGIPEFECNDNPIVVMGILCAKFPHSAPCEILEKLQDVDVLPSTSDDSKRWGDLSTTSLILLVLTIFFAIVSLILGVVVSLSVRRRNKRRTNGNSTDQIEQQPDPNEQQPDPNEQSADPNEAQYVNVEDLRT